MGAGLDAIILSDP